MTVLNIEIDRLHRWLKPFKKWIRRHNCPIYEPRGSNEFLRFGTSSGDGVIQWSTEGKIICNPIASKAVRVFKAHGSWSSGYDIPVDKIVCERVNRSSEDKARLYRALAERDGGMYCAYCGAELKPGQATIEHVIPLSKHGLDLMDNMILACQRCNNLCANLSVIEKIKRIQAHKEHPMEKYGVPPEELSKETKGYDDIVDAEEAKLEDDDAQKKQG